MLQQFKFNNLLILNFISYIFKSYLIRYPAPKNIGYFWNFGVLSVFFFFVQFISGFFLAMFYTPNIEYAFFSIEYIMNDIHFGWLIRYIHANGASFFFFVIYIHLLRGIYYSSYKFPRTNLWLSGLIIYFLLMATAFLGYVLPWGQMSFWAATVITNFLTVVPIIGQDLLYWIWGGYSINNATLNRFFCLHFILPFIIIILIIFHIFLLHQVGSSNELKFSTPTNNKINFFPFFILKDLFSIFIVLFLFNLIVFFFPELFNHAINYIQSNPIVTPTHIVPEWYFLPFYAILRSILNKTYGIIVMFLSMILLFLFSIFDTEYFILQKYNIYNIFFFWYFFFNFIFLGFLGSQTAEYPCVEFGLLCSIIHFFFCLIYLPLISSFEKYIFFIKF